MKIINYDSFKINETKILSFDNLHQYDFMKDPELKKEFIKGEDLSKKIFPGGVLRHEDGEDFSISFSKGINNEEVKKLISDINSQNNLIEFSLVSEDPIEFSDFGKNSEYIFQLKGKIK